MDARWMPIALCCWVMLQVAEASRGDRLPLYKECQGRCWYATCTPEAQAVKPFPDRQSWAERLLRWSCPEECAYKCMWITIHQLQKEGKPVEQFHGKWPFTRVLGVQEPASTVFSVLNGLFMMFGMVYFTRRTSPKAPMYGIWIGLGLTGVNAWIWSTVFHSRDSPATEKMDYFSALAHNLFNLFAAIARLLVNQPRKWTLYSGMAIAALYLQHIVIMTSKFDYRYNLIVSVTAGAITYGSWLAWFAMVWRRQPYVWSGTLTAVSIMILSTLEIWDFPPLFWILDAHSLWHLGTIPFPLLWFKFCVADCRYLLQEKFKANQSLRSTGKPIPAC